MSSREPVHPLSRRFIRAAALRADEGRRSSTKPAGKPFRPATPGGRFRSSTRRSRPARAILCLLSGAGAALHAEPCRETDDPAETGDRASAGPHRRPCCWDRLPSKKATSRWPSRTTRTRSSTRPTIPFSPQHAERNGRAKPTSTRTFEEARYDRFRVMFEGRAEQSLATQATGYSELSLFWRIGEKLGSYPTDDISSPCCTPNSSSATSPGRLNGRAAQYDGRIRIPAAGASRNPEPVRAHPGP